MQRAGVTLVFALSLLGFATASPAQQGADTALTVEGFLQNDEQFDLWTIVAPLPLQALGVRTFVLPLVGRGGRWSRYRNEYVAARGRVARVPGGGTPGIGIDVEKMTTRTPPRTTHRTVDHGFTLHADVTLSVVPDRFAWRDAQGDATGVNPIALDHSVPHRACQLPGIGVLPAGVVRRHEHDAVGERSHGAVREGRPVARRERRPPAGGLEPAVVRDPAEREHHAHAGEQPDV